jgi:hypothetical protein
MDIQSGSVEVLSVLSAIPASNVVDAAMAIIIDKTWICFLILAIILTT